jgi:predicted unusual protein kinase regulating ubiquinone biosynthesis (AarF/ABC1/UbiB family)
MTSNEVKAAAVNQAAEEGAPAVPNKALTLEAVIQEVAAQAPKNCDTEEGRTRWAVASLIAQMTPSYYESNQELKAFIDKKGSEGNFDEAMKFLKTVSPHELACMHRCFQVDAEMMRVTLRPAGIDFNLFELFKSGELPIELSDAFFKGLETAVIAEEFGMDQSFENLKAKDANEFVNFEQKQWGFGKVDPIAIMKLMRASGYDLSTITTDEILKLMALARLCDNRLGDIPAFFGRILNKMVPDITLDDVKTLFKMHKTNKLIDPLLAVKPGRTADVISIFRGDKLPSSTPIPGKEMVRIVTTLRELAKDGGAKEVTVRFNDKAVKLRQLESGHLYITVNGVMVAGAQTAATFAKLFASDMASRVDQYGADNLLRMLPELTMTDLANEPGAASHTRELCVRILSDRFDMPPTAFATVPTATLRTIAANALKGYYTTETGAQNKTVVSSLLATNTRNDVFTGEEVRDLHAAMMNTSVEELNRKVVFPKAPEAPKVLVKSPEVKLAETQEKVRNLFADFIMNADIISYDEAQRKGEGSQRILNLLKANLDTFVDVIMDPKNALAGLAEPMRSAIEEHLMEMADELPNNPDASDYEKGVMKNLYKRAFTIMLTAAELPEAERAPVIQKELNANWMLKAALNKMQTTVEEFSSKILEVIPKIAQLDTAMGELVTTAMAEIQRTVNEKFGALEEAPEEVEVAEAPRQEIWQQSFERLMGGALTDTKSGYGKFMHEVLSHYFVDASPQEGRQMLASLFRNTDANSTPGQVVGALFKGAGPLLQKILQALPTDALGEDMTDALKDMKSNLQPIPEAIVKAHMLDIVNRSNGEVKSIEVIRSLGAASVGQAFLCKMITNEHPAGEECVVKLLRPNVKAIIESERQRFIEAAKNTPGMEKTFEGQYARILEELDLTKEKTNINFARNVYEQPVVTYYDGIILPKERRVTMNTLHSMEVHPFVPPTMDSLILKKAPGETYDRYIANTRAKALEIVGELNEDGKAHFRDSGSLRAAEAKLIFLYNDTKRRQDFLLQLAEKWVHEALYGNGFYHGDLHAGNIMTDGEGLTVIDFGNATHLTERERKHVIRMMAAAMYGRENYFEESLKALISDEGRAKYDSQNTQGELSKILHEILNKGTTFNAGQRIIAALTTLQQYGIELPGPVYNFAQCQLRLGTAVDEMTKLMKELDAAKEKLGLAPLENGAAILNAGRTLVKDQKVFEGLALLQNIFDSKHKDSAVSFEGCAEGLVGIFGTSHSDSFNKKELPELLVRLQNVFNDREAFDTCFVPVIERLTEAKTWWHDPIRGVESSLSTGDTLREKLNAFLAAREGEDLDLQETAVKELAKAYVDAMRALTSSALKDLPRREAEPEEGAFVGAVANVVNANLRAAMQQLGKKRMISTAFDMYAANSATTAASERMAEGWRRVEFYLKHFTNSTISLSTAELLKNISEDFQHPLKMPGLNGKANSLNTGEKRATFLSTLQFNLTKLEEELRAAGRLKDTTPEEVKKHLVCIAMEFFADRIGGIADAVHRLSDTAYQTLYREASENDNGNLKVCDILAYFRHPIELPPEGPAPAQAPAEQPPAA